MQCTLNLKKIYTLYLNISVCIVTLYKVILNTDLANTGPLLLGEIGG